MERGCVRDAGANYGNALLVVGKLLALRKMQINASVAEAGYKLNRDWWLNKNFIITKPLFCEEF